MELDIKYIPYKATTWDVKRAIGEVLHRDTFIDPAHPERRFLNCKVEVFEGQGTSNNGTGKLTLHDGKIARKFTALANDNSDYAVRVLGKKIRFRVTGKAPHRSLQATLAKTPYLDPDIEEAKETIIGKLDVGIQVDRVQFGVFYRRAEDPPNGFRFFSNEYELSYPKKSAGILQFEYEHKLVRVQLGDRVTEELLHNIVIRFANIRKMAVGLDFGNPFICIEMYTPPIFQLERANRTLTGDWKDSRKYRQRVDSINPSHQVIAPYAHQLRIILHDQRDLEQFRYLCRTAQLQNPAVVKVEAYAMNFYTIKGKKLHNIEQRLRAFEWPVAFQIEAIIHNGLVNTDDFLRYLYPPICEVVKAYPDRAANILRLFTEELMTRLPHPGKDMLDCLQRMCDRCPKATDLYGNLFMSHHVTVTPTRLVLEGPLPMESNRVIREYQDYQENFIRVDFRDEDRLQYRWERDTDGTTLLEERVGGILKQGLVLGGRPFEFLAYSSSALREHVVWFVHPFTHPTLGFLDSDAIRARLGDFSGVINQPSKYAARMAQAFTATEASVRITNEQWEEIEDLGSKPYWYTDGVGTISALLADKIWEALCAGRKESYKRNVKPSAYQIRFLGYKGMVCVDEQLKGIKMRLRKSMNKFKGPPEDRPAIEIARAFERPGSCYLNRPLIMLLEDRGVDKAAFLRLQADAVAAIHMSSDDILRCRCLFRDNSLGLSFRLAHLFHFLKVIGMGMSLERTKYTLKNAFLERLIHFSKNSVLRTLKHGARILVPDSYLLVGVADEGPAYEDAGYTNVFTLKEGEIFACAQGPDDPEPIYIEGEVTISRSPVVHPGDVQRVRAIGKPPEGMLCLFRNLKNLVVLPSVGKWEKQNGKVIDRSLASMLGGGDLDGDLYAIIKEPTLLPTIHSEPADYEGLDPYTLDHASTIEDVCDFVVEYINSDVLGLLSDRHLIIADQSNQGTFDEECKKLAALCSQAVDYPKNGNRVDIHDSPRWLIPFKPDWKKSEDNSPRNTDYYESSRALGELFRNVTLLDAPPVIPQSVKGDSPLSDTISEALRDHITRQLGPDAFYNTNNAVQAVEPLFRRYVDELRYICLTHSLYDDTRLEEEEVVIGSILANCSQHRYRTDRMYRMRLHAGALVKDIQKELYKRFGDEMSPEMQIRFGLSQAWAAWDFATRNRGNFGANSFALIALLAIADALEDLGEVNMLEPLQPTPETDEQEDSGW